MSKPNLTLDATKLARGSKELNRIADELTALARNARSKRISNAALADRLFDIGQSLHNELEALGEPS